MAKLIPLMKGESCGVVFDRKSSSSRYTPKILSPHKLNLEEFFLGCKGIYPKKLQQKYLAVCMKVPLKKLCILDFHPLVKMHIFFGLDLRVKMNVPYQQRAVAQSTFRKTSGGSITTIWCASPDQAHTWRLRYSTNEQTM